LIGFFFFRYDIKFPACFFSNRIDLANMLSEVKGLNGSQKGLTPTVKLDLYAIIIFSFSNCLYEWGVWFVSKYPGKWHN